MEFICNRDDLLNGLNVAQKAITKKSTLNILEGVYIQGNEEGITLLGNDLEMGCMYKIKGVVKRYGELCLHAKIFTDIVRKLRADEVHINVEGDRAFISSGNTNLQLQTMPAEQYPKLEYTLEDCLVTLEQAQLKRALKGSLFALGINEMRPVFTGVKFLLSDHLLTVLAMDGYKIAIRKENSDFEGEKEFIVPGRTLIELLKILEEEGDIQIYSTLKQVIFKTAKLTLTSRLLEVNSVDYKQFIFDDPLTKVTVAANDLVNLIETASAFILNGQNTNVPLVLEIKDQRIWVKCQSVFGNIEDYIGCKAYGQPLKIGFNYRYLLETIRACDTEFITLFFKDNRTHCMVTPMEGETYVYITAPVII
ncbi:DNA polymerase III subunit beta [Vallitalea okinawensis]|uniref:DNA polymerase III subunit beta n=1 Tax=Vallitalea okinawensis TaxID=2078660 RepID=UPI000CFA9BA5|nr:DNA polymerase III subunit beta [Vallitalea okinawensis]